MKLKLLLLFTLGFYFNSIKAQTYTGTVKDSVNAPLHGANLIAIPDSDDLSMAFSISDEKGRYRLNL
ncbi:carboxypeptidase-like regulatory domain-containing protein, partial [Zunongwangia atlantica 22II14-10F7]|uniref:carboxypeptidase-like regulatory domain-containing protein n=1 Tax=Zunongwangia atlantica TaxID=1502297 RepID=UPI003613C5FE